MILITIGTGSERALLLTARFIVARTRLSGEIGHMIPDASSLVKSFIDFGAARSVASATGMADRALRFHRPMDHPSSEEIFEAARQGAGWARDHRDETVDYLTIAVANLAVSFDPELIVLGGALTPYADSWQSQFQNACEAPSPTSPPSKLRIWVCGLR